MWAAVLLIVHECVSVIFFFLGGPLHTVRSAVLSLSGLEQIPSEFVGGFDGVVGAASWRPYSRLQQNMQRLPRPNTNMEKQNRHKGSYNHLIQISTTIGAATNQTLLI